MRIYALSLIMLACYAPVSCGPLDHDSSAKSQSSPGAAPPGTPAPGKSPTSLNGEVAKLSAALEGSWDSGCDSQGFQGSGAQRIVVTYSGSEVSFLVQLFSDSKCTSVDFTSKSSGKFKIGAASELVSGAFEYDVSYLSAVVTPNSAESLKSFKTELSSQTKPECLALAGKIELNKPFDISNCKANAPEFSLIRVSGNELSFGGCSVEENNCKSAEQRPTFMVAPTYQRKK